MKCSNCEGLEKIKAHLLKRQKAIDEDERFHYPPATIEINAPLALIQYGMEIEMSLITKALKSEQ